MPPLDPKIAHRIDPQYAEFHNAILKDVPGMWEVSLEEARQMYERTPTMEPVEVEKEYDITAKARDGHDIPIRVWVPKGSPPPGGWPLFFHIHGGGWVIGSRFTESSHMSHWAQNAQCIVTSIDYRLGPEHRFPIPVNDVIDGYKWMASQGFDKLNVDKTRIAVGGSSAGASLSAGICHYVNQNPGLDLPKPILQVLIVPSVDTRPNPTPASKELENSPGLPKQLMAWFIERAITSTDDLSDPYLSPILQPEETFKNQPPALFIVGELDILQEQAAEYASKLKAQGNVVDYSLYKGSTHLLLSFSGLLDKGKAAVEEVTKALVAAYNQDRRSKI